MQTSQHDDNDDYNDDDDDDGGDDDYGGDDNDNDNANDDADADNLLPGLGLYLGSICLFLHCLLYRGREIARVLFMHVHVQT